MPRERNPNRDRAYQIWLDHGGSITNREIATQLGENEKVVAVWKQRDRWNVVQQSDAKAVQQTESTTKRTTGQIIVESDRLTEKQRIFIMEYMRDFNITRAAIAAGYSKKTAHVVGWEALNNPKVQSELKRLKEQIADELGLDIKRIIAELMKIAFADVADAMEFGREEIILRDKDGKPVTNPDTGERITLKRSFVTLRNADEIDTSVIAEVKKGKDGVSIKMHDKMRALEKLERYLPYMTEEERLRIEKLKADIKAAEMKGF